MKHYKITIGIRDGDNEYTETWEMDNPCSGFFGELLPDSDPDKLTDMDNKFLLNHFFGEGLCLGEDDEGNESLEATEDEGGCYWLGSGERLVWIEGIEEIRPIPRGIDIAIGEYLSSWGELSTDEVIAILKAESEEGNFSVQNEKICVWFPHEDSSAGWLLDHIETCASNIDEAIKEVLQ